MPAENTNPVWLVLWRDGERVASRPLSDLPAIQEQFIMSLIQRDVSGTEHWNVLGRVRSARGKRARS